ncbi:MAG TPA: hypothetical protein PKE16_16115 [Hyphomicrobium sp.]|nr:hypothetical protein [Hyphomicrobium sp.]
MSEIDQKLSDAEKQIREIERQAAALRQAGDARPTAVNDKDVQLMDRLLAAWQSLRASISRHPEFRERARDLALKRATGRAKEK